MRRYCPPRKVAFASNSPCPLLGPALVVVATGCGVSPSQSPAPGGDDGGPSAYRDAASGADAAVGEDGNAGTGPGEEAGVGDDGRADTDSRTDTGVLDGSDAAPPGTATALGHCAGPTGAKWSDAQAAYAKWKNDLLTSNGARGFLRVRRPNSPGAINTSNSEGTAYGMMLAAAMDDQAVLDALWQYEQVFLDANGLMNWEISTDGSGPTSQGTGAATDADEDMAFALLWADRRWGGKGTLADTYRNLALKQIDLIWQHEVDHGRGEALAPGDQFPNAAAILNISYFAPGYYRLFGAASGNQTNWSKVVESSYTILAATLNVANKNASSGLVPAWSTPAGAPQAPNASLPTNHQLDSCRAPFRFGQDYCWYGEPRAKGYLAKIGAFYQQIGAKSLVDGYNLDGTPNPTHPTVNQSAAFVGTAGVGAMSDPAFALLRDQAYAGVATLNELDGSLYYTESWTALSLAMMSGGFWNPAAP